MRNLTAVKNIREESATSMPADFSNNLKSLQNFNSVGCPYTSVVPFFNGSTVDLVDIYRLEHLAIDSSLYLPMLRQLSVDLTLPAPETFTFESSSFPQLNYLDIVNDGQIPTIIINTSLTLISVKNTIVTNYFPSNVRAYQQSTITENLNQYVGLESLTIIDSSDTSPLTYYPPNLKSMIYPIDKFTTFPTTPLGSKTTTFGLQFSNYVGEVPWNLFSGFDNLVVLLDQSKGISGVVPESFCSNKLLIKGTSISSVPDCYWCFVKDPTVFQTSLTISPTFSCNMTIDNFDIITVGGNGILKGNLIGWGNIGSGYVLSPKIANKELLFTKNSAAYGVKTPITLQLNPYYSQYIFNNFTYLEVQFQVSTYTMIQVPMGIYRFSITFLQDMQQSIPYLTHSILFNNKTGSCNIVNIVGSTIECDLAAPLYRSKTNDVFLSNGFFNLSNNYPLPTTTYPYIQSTFEIMVQVGTELAFSGVFGPAAESALIYIDGNATNCINSGVSTSGHITCRTTSNINGGPTNVTIWTIDGFASPTFTPNYQSPRTNCQQTTSNCSGNGVCNINGQCDCNNGYYLNDCTNRYPIISSGSVDLNDTRLISLFGDFGPFGQTNATVFANNTLNCLVTFKSQQSINCTLPSIPSVGLLSFTVQVDSITPTIAKDLIYIYPNNNNNNTGGNSKEQCEKETFNCHGHGVCDDNGVCQCYPDYQVDDNCLTKIINNTNQPNNTAPTPSFNIDGLSFQFEMIAIHQIDIDNQIVFELLTNNWISNITNNTDTTIVNYQLNKTLDNNNNNATTITSTISFSTKPRNIPFGSQSLQIKANSIKLAVNISQWNYQSALSTLRVLFKTTINNNQSVEYDCQEEEIQSLTFDQISDSIQYLRVVKDNIQFTGRFVDYVLSNGRDAFSKTYLINQTNDIDNSKQSNIIIGIGMPQCQSCILDPDFTPLLIDKSNDGGCDKKSNTWKIIVGVVIGGVALIAISVASIMHFKKKKLFNRQQKAMSATLKAMK
ncbi:hypothetical protein DFA_00573 [Cavenderia fasciculata]|uniref:EGF-like domain-containing protein n=1 Tax=Cavenderia fasciculata TaxID=261658 RepID=F4PSM0_CACFS|nr:uncharacterized protein DFA_00573 [Cavenderia fasciculata]EGG20712.1 hypothetical protein DFA_00573 [Cavenderia fasciculata]|eukprot:XP_004358562.1 hypothetical protein DFA_00573 [Cavenderia fasciculata]